MCELRYFVKWKGCSEDENTWELPGNHLGTTWEPPGNHLGTTWEPPGNHLGTTWEPPGNHLGTTWEPPESLENAQELIESFHVENPDMPSRVDVE